MAENKNEVNIYCYVKVSVVGIGMVGPTTPAKTSRRQANKLIKESPSTWSLKPFEIKKEIKEEVTNA